MEQAHSIAHQNCAWRERRTLMMAESPASKTRDHLREGEGLIIWFEKAGVVCGNSSGEKSVEAREHGKFHTNDGAWGWNQSLVEIRQLGISDGNSDFDSTES